VTQGFNKVIYQKPNLLLAWRGPPNLVDQLITQMTWGKPPNKKFLSNNFSRNSKIKLEKLKY
jgi:hypothetical protein